MLTQSLQEVSFNLLVRAWLPSRTCMGGGSYGLFKPRFGKIHHDYHRILTKITGFYSTKHLAKCSMVGGGDRCCIHIQVCFEILRINVSNLQLLTQGMNFDYCV